MPTASEILDIMDRLERDKARRHVLSRGYEIFRACVADGIVGDDSIDWLAQRMQELTREGLIAHGAVGGRVREPGVWDSNWLQSIHEWRVTARGRQDAALYRQENHRLSTGSRAVLEPSDQRDVFISHAGEDKEAVARPLALALIARGWTVWLDEGELTVGDSLSRSIDAALARSRFGVVVLSPSFFAKEWPRRELAGLVAREVDLRSKVILPVWHGVDRSEVGRQSPTLADRLGVPTTEGIDEVANKISLALRAGNLVTSEPIGQVVAKAWRGILGGTTARVSIGDHVIDATTGLRGRVEQVIGPQSVMIRLDDGRLVSGRPG